MEAPSIARHAAENFSHTENLDGGTTPLVIITGELVVNAVLHGREPIEVVFHHVDGDVVVDVRDAGAQADDVRLRIPDEATPGGRGLHIVDALADSWAVQTVATGISVRATIHE